MRTLAKKTHLQVLEEQLQQRLQAAGLTMPLQLSCALMEDTLLVVGEHSPSVTLKTEPTLTVLQEAILEIQPKSAQQIGLCLRITGQKQPYAFHSFTLDRPMRSKVPVKVVPAIAKDVWESEETETARENPPVEEHAAETTEVYPSLPPSQGTIVPFTETFGVAENPFESEDLEAVTPDAAEPEEDDPEPLRARSPISLLTLVWVASAGVATALLLSGIYGLTRPCVLGECSEISLAKQLSQQSEQTLKLAQSSNSPIEAQQQLQQAVAQLETIPFWSPRYWDAQGLLKTYKQQNQDLSVVIGAAKKATIASQNGINPPHSAEQWQQIESLWQEAMTPLEQLPKSSFINPLAQKKLKEYQGNLKNVEQRILAEQQAEKKLTNAKTIADLAEAREGFAQFPETWQTVEENWRTTLRTLAGIPNGTTGYEQAQFLLPKYETKLIQARDRKTQEEMAVQSYTDAVTLAAQARIFEKRNGWFQAVEYWRRALTAAEQVPASSSYYLKAQPLVSPYKASLQQAEAQLREERKLQKARKDLNKTCNGALKVCDYTVSKDLIAVQMTPAYVQHLQQTLKAAGNQDAKIRQGMEKHIETLRVALKAISDNAGIKLQVYDADGKRIGSNIPRT